MNRVIIGLCAFYVPIIAGLIYATTLPTPIEGWEKLWPAFGALLAAQCGYYFGRLVEYARTKEA